MPLLLNPWVLGGIGVFLAGSGFFVDKTGEGIESASNGILKLAAAGAVGFYVLKKTKVI